MACVVSAVFSHCCNGSRPVVQVKHASPNQRRIVAMPSNQNDETSARLNQFVLEQQISCIPPPQGSFEEWKSRNLHMDSFTSNKHLSDETWEAVAAASLVALQYIAC